MLRSMNDLENYTVHAIDGTIGHVTDFYFDDEKWVIRYLVVDTGSWLLRRNVLISPVAIGQPDWAEKILPVSITQEQVKNSPDIDTDKPVSRQNEIHYLGYYGYPLYWGGVGLWGGGIYPNLTMLGDADLAPTFAQAEAEKHQDDDPHLRSGNEVMGYYIQAVDGDIGHVKGLLVDEKTWAIRYFIVDTSNWWFGHLVLVSPRWIQKVSWSDNTVSLKLTRQAIQDAPTYDPMAQLTRVQEVDIFEHYGHSGYWGDDMKPEEAI